MAIEQAKEIEIEQVGAKVAELAGGDDDRPEEVHGVYLSVKVIVQCAECGTVLPETELVNSNTNPASTELDDHAIVCPTCSKVAGHEVVIPLYVLAGDHTTLVPDAEDEAPAPAGEGAA